MQRTVRPANMWRNIALVGCVLPAVALVVRLGAHPIGGNSAELQPGNARYPITVANPTTIIPLIVSGPDAVDMRFIAVYASDAKRCQHQLGLGVYGPFTLEFPIGMTRTDEGYRGTVTVDKFQPGNCGWQFAGVSYGLTGETVLNPLTTLDEDDVWHGPAESPRDFWCYRVSHDQHQVHACEELASIRWSNGIRAVSSQFLSGFTSQQLTEEHRLRITAQTKELRVNLHDLNAIEGALIPVGSIHDQSERAKAEEAAMKKSPEYRALECAQQANLEYLRSHHTPPDAVAQKAEIKAEKKKCRVAFGLPVD